MRWTDELVLISRPDLDGKDPGELVDAEGFPVVDSEVRTEVFCNKKSVGQTEYYKAEQSGQNAVCKFEVLTAEYSGERLCEYEGRRLFILRTFDTNNGEVTELTVSDLPRGGRING